MDDVDIDAFFVMESGYASIRDADDAVEFVILVGIYTIVLAIAFELL